MEDQPIQRGERTRQAIIAVAHELFVQHGYHGTSMRQIAQRADIALGGIYNHFASKDDIFRAVLMEHHPFHDILPAMLAAHGSTSEAFARDAAQKMVAGFGDRRDFLNLMFIELVEFKGQHMPALFEHFFPKGMEFADRFVANCPGLKPIPRMIVMRAFIGLFFSYGMTDLIMGTALSPEAKESSLNYFVDIFLYGILSDQPGARDLQSED